MLNHLTLIIPAKKEKESVAFVINEIRKKYPNLKMFFIVEKNDFGTINMITALNCNIIYQKNKGYGDALILGINNVKTKYFCIFNADGSFDPAELNKMLVIAKLKNSDFIFASRYEKNCSSDDDTIITKIGNFFFTKLGQLLFKLSITDILYTFVLGNTKSAAKLNLKEKDFRFCVELPIKAKLNNMKSLTSKSHERKRYSGVKKVNAFKDGLLILSYMLKAYLKKNK